MNAIPFKIGDPIHGFAGGAFGRDSYNCRRVEAIGNDWIVTRDTSGAAAAITNLPDIFHAHANRNDRSYCGFDCDMAVSPTQDPTRTEHHQ